MKLYHPNDPNHVIEPKAEHTEAYKSQGWRVVETADEKRPKGK